MCGGSVVMARLRDETVSVERAARGAGGQSRLQRVKSAGSYPCATTEDSPCSSSVSDATLAACESVT
jgi:hypothetical protein